MTKKENSLCYVTLGIIPKTFSDFRNAFLPWPKGYHVIKSIVKQQQEQEKPLVIRTQFMPTASKLWAWLEKSEGWCQSDSPSLTACPKALYCTEGH